MKSFPRFSLPITVLFLALISYSVFAQSQRMNSTDLGNIDVSNTTNTAAITRPPVVEPVKPEEHQGLGRLGFRLNFLSNGLPQIVGLTQGGPALDAGLKLGDTILKVDKNSTLALTQDEVRLALHGDPGTGVELTVLRNDEPLLIVVALKRKILLPGSHDLLRGPLPGQLYQPDPSEIRNY